MQTLTLYSRRGCHLCEELLETLLPIARGRCEVEVVDIDSSTELTERYHARIPVLAAGDAVLCEGQLNLQMVYAWLSDPEAFD